MAHGKPFRLRPEKRMPAFQVMVTAVVIGAFCLIGIWLFRSPSESRVAEKIEGGTAGVKLTSKEEAVRDNDVSRVQSDLESGFDTDKKDDDSVKEEANKKPVSVLNIDEKATDEDPKGSSEEENDDEVQKDSELVEEKATNGDPKGPSEEKNHDKVQKDSELVEEKATDGEPKGPSEEQNHDEVQKDSELVEEKATDEDPKGPSEEENHEKVQRDSELIEEKARKDAELEETGAAQSEIQIENQENTGNWATQASESKAEIEKVVSEDKQKSSDNFSEGELPSNKKPEDQTIVLQTEGVPRNDGGEYSDDGIDSHSKWRLCEFDGAVDYVPCLDNKEAIRALRSTKHYEHRERHCPNPAPTCVVPFPEGYRSPIGWPKSRQEIWYKNVPHPGLVSYKKDQNWVKLSGDRFVFPGGGTQFKRGALHYIDFIEQVVPDIGWGNHTRVVLDIGCGVASFGGYMFDRDMLTMSFAPKDEHEAQVQLALERGIPAISAVMGTQRLVFPSNAYDVIHCARCRVPWHIEGGKLLLELNRVLRPGGYFVWSATPVYWQDEEDVSIWKDMVALTAAMCWQVVVKTKDPETGVGYAVFHKPTTNFCYENRKENSPPLCDEVDKPDAAWYVPMTACIHKIPSKEDAHGFEWPQEWPLRLTTAPSWLSSEKGLYGKPAAADFRSDTEHWQRVVEKSYLHGFGIDWKKVRNVMDMKAVYGGFAAALISQPVWVMNVVQFDEADTLPIIFDRGLFGIYHDWCESFSSYPRTYDLLHADHLFSKLKKRCDIKSTIAEMDRLLRPEGWAIFRDKVDVFEEIRSLLESLHWDVRMTYSKADEALLAVQKTRWRPEASS